MSEQLSTECFGVVVTAQMRHGDLWRLRQRLGSSKAAATAIGIEPTTFSAWLNLRSYPKYFNEPGRRAELAAALESLTGKPLPELYPLALCEAIDGGKLVRRAEIETQYGLALSAARQTDRFMLPSPEDAARRREVEDIIGDSFCVLTERERSVLEMLYGLNGWDQLTFREAAKHLGVCLERVRQISLRAHRKLESELDRRFPTEDDRSDALRLLSSRMAQVRA